jgi:endonuclease YncB( thermonuclease family)
MTGPRFTRRKALDGWKFGAMAVSIVLSLSSQVAPLAAAPVVAAGQTFRCTAVAVWDGDGPIWCAEGPRIRLAGLAAREHDETCREYQPCPQASGIAARNSLVALLGGAKGVLSTGHVAVRGTTLQCRSEGNGKGTRTAAWCTLPNGYDLTCAMIASGTAIRWARSDPTDRCRSRR